MKKHFIILLVLITAKVFPQQNDQQPYQNITSYNSNATKVAKYQKMQSNGIIMASLGGAALAGGLVLYISGLKDDVQASVNNSSGTYPSNSAIVPDYIPKMMGGAALATIGGVALAGGIVMIKIGKRKEKRWSNQVSVFALPNAFRIAYKF